MPLRLATRVLFGLALVFGLCAGVGAAGIEPALLAKFASEDAAEKGEAIDGIAAIGDEAALSVLSALRDGLLKVTGAGQMLIIERGKATDAATGAVVDPVPDDAEKVTINNRLRTRIESAIGALRIFSKDPKERLAAVATLTADEKMLPTLDKALASETDPAIKSALAQVRAASQLKSSDAAKRLAAIAVLAESLDAKSKNLLLPLVEKSATGEFAEPDEKVRQAAQATLSAIERRLAVYDYAGRVFTGLSLGSILLLVALGLAITYGLLGVINMAHGEMLMIGAYATYATQTFFRAYFPAAIDWYVVFALPVAFLVAGGIGILLERSVIRWLYGRPLETLLATWGISLFLIQLVRQLFGAQNVEVSNPTWMSGGITVVNLVLPWNRIVIIGFSMTVLLLVWLMLTRTRLGLFVRGVTQNRTMASCVGVPTGRVDMIAFGLGSGIAGLAGCALSQIGNVGPELGQSYIIDSFMVVVLGGVGQLAGTVYASLGLGVASKFLEPYIGAVPTKILILVLIIAFIQKRPQGLFALKGRSVET